MICAGFPRQARTIPKKHKRQVIVCYNGSIFQCGRFNRRNTKEGPAFLVLLFFIGNFLFDARIVKETYEFMDKFSVKGGCRVEVFRRMVN